MSVGAREKDRLRLLDSTPHGLVEDPLPFHCAFLLHLGTDEILSAPCTPPDREAVDALASLAVWIDSVTSAVRPSTLFQWPSWATLYETR